MTVNAIQQQLFLTENNPKFPSTRFQGSKLKLVDWIWDAIKNIRFDTVLDAFGGTGSVAYLLKSKGKKVTYNDILKFNWHIGTALVENDAVRLGQDDIDFIFTNHKGMKYPTLVYDTFKDIYFTDEENQWIDRVSTNIGLLEDRYKRSMAYFALFQACIIKRPFNLFHRKNLYIRFSDVQRSFGNKASWDRSFESHFRKFADEANQAVISNGHHNKALNTDVFDIKDTFDLVYIDTPYISQKGVGVDYHGFYHFLEGLVNYSQWNEMIDHKTKHKRLKKNASVWADKHRIEQAFDRLFSKFKDSVLVVSYRSDGIPSVKQLKNLMNQYKTEIIEIRRKKYKYVLSNHRSEEVLVIGK
ncbi:DNA adenine methylase [Desulfonema magnum]|uniref:SAM-dependent methyltransferase n=1 Tax=Desulfonema magnum TaxID=45655 RepID=A0A975BFZ2_9BACT|nr:DNA adenine methylase [Desulfonema magnum]QTA84593.1 SAM-dependent methyltransferase [Desulfonema magnum]